MRERGSSSSRYLHAHRPRGAFDDLHRLLDVTRVQILELRLGDRADLIAREPADFLAVRLSRSLGDPERLLDQHGRRRRLRDEGERTVLVDRDLYRRDAAPGL